MTVFQIRAGTFPIARLPARFGMVTRTGLGASILHRVPEMSEQRRPSWFAFDNPDNTRRS